MDITFHVKLAPISIIVDDVRHGNGQIDTGVILELLHTLIDKVDHMAVTFDEVLTKVTALSTVEDSVIALLTDIKAKLDAAIASGADPVKLQALSDAIDAQKVKLGDAVVANTPAA